MDTLANRVIDFPDFVGKVEARDTLTGPAVTETFGDVLKVNGRTQRSAAEMLGVSTVIMNRWAVGKAPLPLARVDALAEWMGIEWESLLQFVSDVGRGNVPRSKEPKGLVTLADGLPWGVTAATSTASRSSFIVIEL